MKLIGRHLYAEMRNAFDYSPVIMTAMREHPEIQAERAKELLDALFQWLSVIPLASKNEPLQMLEGVDPLWHAFILNTKMYREFCQRFFGEFLDHDPMDPINSTLPKKRYARFTLALLEKEFGLEVHPTLQDLTKKVQCCMGACGD